jgi:hypothetical protein
MSRGSRHEPRWAGGWSGRLDSPQRVAAKNPFPANRALVEFEVRDGVGPSLDFAGPVSADLLDLIATASRTERDLLHISFWTRRHGAPLLQIQAGVETSLDTACTSACTTPPACRRRNFRLNRLPLEFTGPIPADLLNLITSASWAISDF